MDVLELSRIQFAATTIFHYFFVPLSIGLAFIIALMQTMYVVKGQEIYKKMTKFWTQIFLVNFAVGVVTGILQEFQFGMNWSTYSRFVGDVFGPSLAIEGLLAFFIESTFLGLWVFGWDKLPKRIHLLCIWLLSIGTMLSSFWILTASAFMHAPVGYEIVDGRAQMNDFLAIIQNPQLWVQFPHTITAAMATGAFFIAGVSAWKIGKKQETAMFKKSFRISIIVGTISTALVLFFGHAQAQHLIKSQPMKMAAAEALWNTSEDPAPFTVVANIDPETKSNSFEIQIPYLLSVLSYDKFSGQVEGMNQLQAEYEAKYGPGDYIPPVRTMFWSFRAMVMSGTFMLILGAYGWFLSRKNRLTEKPLYLKLMVYAIALPFIGNTVGWIMTEMGRQPWVVFGVMKTEDAVSPNVTFGEVLFSLISFTSLYLILGGISVYLFVRIIKGHANKKAKKDYQSHDPFDKEEEYVVS
ncbi:cytochrome D ubiquinol oxidase subunit I [Bacillus manliponensis]|uniref:Cytochrome D ubiquinol oxidase subunit I n=1 Tax=Bacillus manliponensis TaxID=574376 RepID=A0A073JUH2_9BACI|nr:cytochrome ubiquinol oxidase subunit I [Bacillus manliponensis]KEK18704.1 cytochrome D ubiquinol oxidase subunit I [Bacillus manliponensis]